MMVALRMFVACGLVAAGISGVRAETSPYAGMQNRGLKALSEQQIEDLRGGRGMGVALTAELNGYPLDGRTCDSGRPKRRVMKCCSSSR